MLLTGENDRMMKRPAKEKHLVTDHSLTITFPSEATALLLLSGDWTLDTVYQEWESVRRELEHHHSLQEIHLDGQALGLWDSNLLALLQSLGGFVAQRGIRLDLSNLPEGVQRLLTLSQAVPERAGAGRTERQASLLYRVGELTLGQWRDFLLLNAFVGELILSLGRLLSGRANFRRVDLFRFLQSAGPEALPIVTLIGLLVGAVLAFVGAVQLQMFGAEIYVANLVALGSVREMGAMMTAIIMAGRTGSA